MLKFAYKMFSFHTSKSSTEANETEAADVPPEFNEEEAKRFKDFFGQHPEKWMKKIPSNVVGIGYHWVPILFKSSTRTIIDDFLKDAMELCVCDRTTKIVETTEDEITKEVAEMALNLGCHPMGYSLGVAPRFFDPKEISDAFDKLKKQPDSFYFSTMMAMDYLKINIQGHILYFTQSNTHNRANIQLGKYSLTVHCHSSSDPRIFNWVMDVEIELS